MDDSQVRLKDVCPDLGKPWWRVPHLLKLNILLLVPFLTSYIGGFDGSMINGIQTVPNWQEEFNHPSGGILGLVTTMQVIGGALSLPISPWVTDRYGRRLPIAIGGVIVVAGAALQGGTQNLAGFHCWPGSIFTAIYNTSWYLGSIVAAWTTFGTFRMNNSWSWRIPSLMQAIPSIVQIIFIYFVPESPRWLSANDRTEEATRILSKYHSGTTEPTELVRFEIAEIITALQFEREGKSTSWLQFFRTRGNIHRLFITAILGFIIQWCGNSLISSYLALVLTNIGITDPETQNIINGGLQIFNFAVAVTSATFIDKLGRRFLFLVSTCGMMLAFVIWVILSARNEQQNYEPKSLGIAIVAMVFVFYAFYNMAMSPLPIAYLVEILPYTLRAKGLSVFNFSQYCSSMFNGFVNPIGLDALSWRYYIVFVAALLLWLVIIWFTFPETKGMSLEEVSKIFDGEDALRGTERVKEEIAAGTAHVEAVVVKGKDKDVNV
ncbi:hypothetical protein BJY04DRAFT_208668 [Aspergillus karnatakaensis]|uniref:uncharacterized protein n=1 Tax=Aspergillus karnatakaensis TaxID=1810916 RepID=UPI003CCD16B8